MILPQLTNKRATPLTAWSSCILHITILLLLLLPGTTTPALCMTADTLAHLRKETRQLFYHGYTNYLTHAFPEDELKPLSCQPRTRNRENPADIGLNDVLGNYSLTLVDSLSTLAILASEDDDDDDGRGALRDFQRGVVALAELYGDGREGSCGNRACGFDLDSKVQVFETNIRGVGGLLSAHLFAIGELPIRGYTPSWIDSEDGSQGIQWPDAFIYSNQLLNLAYDLAKRLLPAFSTSTGIPYPRVNLRHGIPFYEDAMEGVCRLDGTSTNPREITETCSAGAGSLVLEFAVLTRLTGDERFERLAKEAFWAVWTRRSAIGLLGSGLDAENGQWTMPPLAGIGAGVDSFFEYALKSHILLSSSVSDEESNAFLNVWTHSHTAIKHHILRSNLTEKHPYYGQSDLLTGAPRFNWIDNLSAYYPGLLTLAGELNEAIESHILFSALWTRYSALPERWTAPPHGSHASHPMSGTLDPNFKHWAGRPEFIESTYYLYQATKDSWFLHIGEMVLRDIRRRCWTACGLSSLSDVVSGEQGDRMESFFLGETVKYLYLLFEAGVAEAGKKGHVLEKWEREDWVFSTEGHPLVVPRKSARPTPSKSNTKSERREAHNSVSLSAPKCELPPEPLPLTYSTIASRPDFFHAAALAQLHLKPVDPAHASPILEASPSHPGISYADVRSPSNYTFYPWTLPQSLIPPKGTSAPIASPITMTLTFPNFAAAQDSELEGAAAKQPLGAIPLGALQKTIHGVLVNSLSNLRFNMIQTPHSHSPDVLAASNHEASEYRVQSIANWALGKNEKVLITPKALLDLDPKGDPSFKRVKDGEWVDLVVDVPVIEEHTANVGEVGDEQDVLDGGISESVNKTLDGLLGQLESVMAKVLESAGLSVLDQVLEKNSEPDSTTAATVSPTTTPQQTKFTRHIIPAILPTGPGAAPFPPSFDQQPETHHLALARGSLPHPKIYYLSSTLCHNTLPITIAKAYNILIIHRGDCSFSSKLANIPSFPPQPGISLELVIVISYPEDLEEGDLIKPLLDEVQKTPGGLVRREGLGLVLVGGGEGTVGVLRGVAGEVGGWDEKGRFWEKRGRGADGRDGGGFLVKRRYWFESLGVKIGNLVML